MLNHNDILSTLDMIDHQHLDIRTVTMGISLLDCADKDIHVCADKIYHKITTLAQDLVPTACKIEKELGIPIVNKRISVTPISLVAAACDAEDYTPIALALDRAAKTCGVNFIGGFSALVQKGFTESDRKLIASIPSALSQTEFLCASVNVASTKAGINMDAVRQMGEIVRKTAEITKDRDGMGCAKLVIFANAVEDNPFMAASAVPASFIALCRNVRASRLTWSRQRSKRLLSKSRVWASLLRRRLPDGSGYRSGLWTFPLPRRRQRETA